MHSIRENEDKNQMKKTVRTSLADYRTDNELTAFTNLDFENFYKTM